ncbi:hypothetical protein NX059_006889 [Plenodomus lindquistii]|nr:hypothetical protein NX059_006889 [Plenodomus lindquistii]
MERSRVLSSSSDTIPLNPSTGPYDPPHSYNGGDLAMQYVDASPRSPPMVMSPDIMDAKGGAYTSINPISTPASTFDEEDGQSLHGRQPGDHVKRFDHKQARKTLLVIGLSKLAITVFFCSCIGVTLKSYEGWRGKVVLSEQDVRIFNSLTLGLSLCLGLNLLASLKHYASTLRWSLLTRRYVSLEVFDLILHVSSLASVVKLMIISSPGLRGNTWLRKFRWFRDVRYDGTKWMWLACLLWISINIGSQLLVALLSLFWPMNNSDIPLLVSGTVAVADLGTWFVDPLVPHPESYALGGPALAAAWEFGMEAMVYHEFEEGDVQTDLSGLPGTPLYKSHGSYSYIFLNRDPAHLYTNYRSSSRHVRAVAKCEQLKLSGNGTVERYPENDPKAGSLYIEAKEHEVDDWAKYDIAEVVSGSMTWIASASEYCGPRCTNFTVVQYGEDSRVDKTSVFLCTNEISEVSNVTSKDDIQTHSSADMAAVYGSANYSRVAAGAIAWTGIEWSDESDLQVHSYTQGSKWSPTHVVTKEEVENLLMRFSIGAIAAFDDHGIRYNIEDQHVVPIQGQQLDVDWSYVLSILGGICGIQFAAIVLLLVFANRTIVRDDSFFSMAMLLNPVVARLGQKGMVLSGEEIKNHKKLRFKKIKYDYREGEKGEPHQVDIFFEGRDSKEVRKSWAAGSYS